MENCINDSLQNVVECDSSMSAFHPGAIKSEAYPDDKFRQFTEIYEKKKKRLVPLSYCRNSLVS